MDDEREIVLERLKHPKIWCISHAWTKQELERFVGDSLTRVRMREDAMGTTFLEIQAGSQRALYDVVNRLLWDLERMALRLRKEMKEDA